MNTHTVVSAGTLFSYLETHFKIKKTRLKQMLKFGHISINDRPVASYKHTLRKGDRIAFIERKKAVQKKHASKLPFNIVYEDDVMLIIDKPSGLLTMGTEEEKKKTAYFKLTEYVRAQSRDGK